MKNPVPYVRQRSDSYWEIVFDDPATGKKKRKATGTKDQAEAEKKLWVGACSIRRLIKKRSLSI